MGQPLCDQPPSKLGDWQAKAWVFTDLQVECHISGGEVAGASVGDVVVQMRNNRSHLYVQHQL